MKVENWNYAGIPIVILMVALDIFAVLAFSKGDHQVLPETSVTNIAFDLMGMVICTIIFISVLLDQKINLCTIIFMCIISLETLLLYGDVECWLIDGDVSKIQLNKLANYYLYGMMLIIIMAYWFYLCELYTRYRHRLQKVTWVMFGLFIIGMVLTVTNPWTELYFYIDTETGCYERTDTFYISQCIGLIMTFICLACILKYEDKPRRKAILASYVIIPLIATVAQIFMYGISIQYISMLFSIILIYANIYIDRSSELIHNEAEMTKQRAEVMVSQIQPHFLYNALTSIMNIKGNSPETRDAIADFGKYMRSNLDSITLTAPIPVNREVDQAETYLRLRQLKYKNVIEYSIDLADASFFLPSMTIKTILSVMIEHGAPENGTICISIYTESTEYSHVLCIKEDCMGPRSRGVIANGTDEIDSMISRLESMVNGRFVKEFSENGQFVARIIIPRNTKAVQ